MSDERVYATYWMETPFEIERAAEVVGGEQSSGTFVSVPGETEALKERFSGPCGIDRTVG